MFQDRRQYQRLSPGSPQLVLLDESKQIMMNDPDMLGGIARSAKATATSALHFREDHALQGMPASAGDPEKRRWQVGSKTEYHDAEPTRRTEIDRL